MEGTIAGLPFGKPGRDDTFTTGGPNQQITAEWDSIVKGGRISAQLTGKDKLVGGVEGLLGDLLDKALQEAGEAAAKSVVALVIA
ncbi:MAG TPA: hypothetical protein VFE36_16260 [Candidatus Baltobacteraceae bacterium]|nr:hypothetical protein [Candidatus Baltobacteraceae bacterium]